jgi:hypothetical protein
MSPEQVTGRGAIDARTDLYSLGLVLYEMLTLRPPIEATNRENLLRTIVTKPLAPVSWRNGSLKNDLERVVHKATQKDPDQRYSKAGQLAADLDRYLTGKPVEAPAYHFRLDEREITAARPGQVVLAAVIIFILGFFLFMALASMALMSGIMLYTEIGAAVFAVQTLIACLIGGSGLLIGRGLLAGRVWARWTGVAASGLLTLAALVGTVAMIAGVVAVLTSDEASSWLQPEGTPADPEMPFSPQSFLLAMMAMYSLPLVVGLAMGVTALWALLGRRTGHWFRLAREIRAEHRRVRDELAV